MGKLLVYFILAALSLEIALAGEARAVDVPLIFPIEKNNVRPLPLRFECSLVDENQFQLGDVLMDFREVKFDMVGNPKRKNLSIRFRWPAGLVQTGEIVLKDTTGKAIWQQAIDTSKTKTLAHRVEGESLRTHLGEMISSVPASELLPKIEFLPFFKFCANYEAPATKIYVCSKDLYFRRTEKGYFISARESTRKEAFVEINGRPVDPNGIVVLNDAAETVSMRALLISGATIELETRMKEVEFIDAYSTGDPKTLVVRARGAEPVTTEGMKRKSNDEWEVTLKTERPFAFVKGEGNIPLRQEFLIRGQIRSEKLGVAIEDADDNKTYSSSKSLHLIKAGESTLSPAEKDSSISSQTKKEADWTLEDLETDRLNKRFLKVTANNMDYYAAHSIYRGRSWQLGVAAEAPMRSNIKFGKWFGVHWYLGLESQQKMEKTSTIPDLSYNAASLVLRLNRGLQNMDSGWGIKLLSGTLTAGDDTTKYPLSVSKAGLWADYKFENGLWGFGNWLLLEATSAGPAQTADIELKSYNSMSLALRYNFGSTVYLDYGGRAASVSLESASTVYQSSQSYAFVGFGFFF